MKSSVRYKLASRDAIGDAEIIKFGGGVLEGELFAAVEHPLTRIDVKRTSKRMVYLKNFG